MEIIKDEIKKYFVKNEFKIEKVMKEYNNYIYTIVRNANYNFKEEDIEEIIVDVYLALWKNRQKLDLNKSMSAYISGITKRLVLKKCKNLLNTENIDEFIDGLPNVENIEIELLQSEQNEMLMSELEKLKKEDKEIFILYYYDEKKVREIANIYNISKSKVKSKLFRIRKKLNKVLSKGGYDINE